MIIVMVRASVSMSVIRSSLAGTSTSRPSGVLISNRVLMVVSSTAVIVPTGAASSLAASLSTVKPTI